MTVVDFGWIHRVHDDYQAAARAGAHDSRAHWVWEVNPWTTCVAEFDIYDDRWLA